MDIKKFLEHSSLTKFPVGLGGCKNEGQSYDCGSRAEDHRNGRDAVLPGNHLEYEPYGDDEDAGEGNQSFSAGEVGCAGGSWPVVRFGCAGLFGLGGLGTLSVIGHQSLPFSPVV